MDITLFGYPVVLFVGLLFGSFAGASVWRLRARQLLQDKASGEAYDKAELRKLEPLTKANVKTDRSQCLHCHHTLAWYDLLPLVSWLSTKGRCRYCKRRIGRFEPVIELASAAAFVAYYHEWVSSGASSVLTLIFWLVVIVMMIILFAYDLKWFLLPDVIMLPLIGLGAAYAVFSIASSATPLQLAGSTLLSVGILGGLYLFLWLFSKGAWVGFGDVKLGLALGLLLLDWRLALLTLFLANLFGTLVVLPGLLTKKLSRKTQIPFGPFLILGFGVALLYGTEIIALYQGASISVTTTLLML